MNQISRYESDISASKRYLGIKTHQRQRGAFERRAFLVSTFHVSTAFLASTPEYDGAVRLSTALSDLALTLSAHTVSSQAPSCIHMHICTYICIYVHTYAYMYVYIKSAVPFSKAELKA